MCVGFFFFLHFFLLFALPLCIGRLFFFILYLQLALFSITRYQPCARVHLTVDKMTDKVDIKPLLQKMWPGTSVQPAEIASAISHFFTNQVSESQAASLLICLHFTQMDLRADVMAECAAVMQKAAAPIDASRLRAVIEQRGLKAGKYNGGLVG